MFNRPIFLSAIALISGICLSFLHVSFLPVFLISAGAAFTMFYVRKQTGLCRAVLPLICAIFVLSGFFLAHQKAEIYDNCKLDYGEQLIVTGTIEKIEPHNQTLYVYLDDAQIVRNIKRKNTSISSIGKNEQNFSAGRFLLLISSRIKEASSLRSGNQVRALCSYRAFQIARNEGNFDEEVYYHSLGVSGKAFVNDMKVTNFSYRVIPYYLSLVKERLRTNILGLCDSDTAAVFLSIVTGDRSGLSEETRSLYQISGIAHILAISGLHISILAMTIFRLFRKCLPFSAAALGSGFLLVLFCIMTGLQISAIRAAIMFLVYLLSKGIGKSYDMLNALSFSALVILFSNPYSLTNSGFQLSFIAILGLVLSSKSLRAVIRMKNPLLKSVVPSLSVTLVTLPIIASSYYQIPVYTVLLNLLVIPLMTFVLGSGMIAAVLGTISLAAGRFLIATGVYLLHLIEGVSDIILRFPCSVFITGKPSGYRIILYYALLAFLYLLLRRHFFRKLRGHKLSFSRLVPFLFLGLILALFTLFSRQPAKGLTISMLDVDQGESILIRNTTGTTFLIDAGSAGIDEVWKYRIETALKYQGISQLDYMIVTHPDADHLNGLLACLNEKKSGRIRINTILTPNLPQNEQWQALYAAANDQGIRFLSLCKGMRIKDGSLTLQCLHPSVTFSGDDTNAYSAVLDLEYRGFKALFTGDIGMQEEQLLISQSLLSDYDLLKVAHHGSKYSTGETFLKQVRPEIALISAGIHNSYGHPHPDTLKRLIESGAELYATPYCGQITVQVSECVMIRKKL